MKTKVEANYRYNGTKDHRCHVCVNMKNYDPLGLEGSCRLVEGTVRRNAVCDLFELKERGGVL